MIGIRRKVEVFVAFGVAVVVKIVAHLGRADVDAVNGVVAVFAEATGTDAIAVTVYIYAVAAEAREGLAGFDFCRLTVDRRADRVAGKSLGAVTVTAIRSAVVAVDLLQTVRVCTAVEVHRAGVCTGC